MTLTQVGRPVLIVGHSLAWVDGEKGQAAAAFMLPPTVDVM